MSWNRASAGTGSRGEEEAGSGSVRSELRGWGRSTHFPEICSHSVKAEKYIYFLYEALISYLKGSDFKSFYCENRTDCPVYYLFKESVVPGFPYAGVPHHQHLNNAKRELLKLKKTLAFSFI